MPLEICRQALYLPLIPRLSGSSQLNREIRPSIFLHIPYSPRGFLNSNAFVRIAFSRITPIVVDVSSTQECMSVGCGLKIFVTHALHSYNVTIQLPPVPPMSVRGLIATTFPDAVNNLCHHCCSILSSLYQVSYR